MIEKFNLKQLKSKNRWPSTNKTRDYCHHATMSDIRGVLSHQVIDYVRKTKKVPVDKACFQYRTKDGKIAVISLDTPKKRLLYQKALEARGNNNDEEPMNRFKETYGFIPRPANVLKKFIEYGFMKSQDVEHLYHNLPVDWEITDDKDKMVAAYSIQLDEKDVVVEGFNGYSCMSCAPMVGEFYYYFGAYMLIFYHTETHAVVGRMVLWKWKDQLYVYKGYVDTLHQCAAKKVRDELIANGTLKTCLPHDFHTELQRVEGKEPYEIYEQIKYRVEVPYVDEDLELSEDRTRMSFCEYHELKNTGCPSLDHYGCYTCEECGEDIDEDDVYWIDDMCLCPNCVKYCHCCDENFRPDADGADTRDDGWVCQECLDESYKYCEKCEEWVYEDEVVDVKDEDGDWITICKSCARDECKKCEECGDQFIPKEEDDVLCACCKEEQPEPEKED